MLSGESDEHLDREMAKKVIKAQLRAMTKGDLHALEGLYWSTQPKNRVGMLPAAGIAEAYLDLRREHGAELVDEVLREYIAEVTRTEQLNWVETETVPVREAFREHRLTASQIEALADPNFVSAVKDLTGKFNAGLIVEAARWQRAIPEQQDETRGAIDRSREEK